MNILLTWIIVVCVSSTISGELELKLINVIFRHGNRQPIEGSKGGLTNMGKLKAYELGQFLRKKYDNFLGDNYDPHSVSARSTGYVRSKMSLQLLFSALFPPKNQEIWNPSLVWQPIAFSFDAYAEDVLLAAPDCPKFYREKEKVVSSVEMQEKLQPFREMMHDLSLHMGQKVENSNDMFVLYHNFVAMETINKTLPEWVLKYYPSPLRDGVFLEYEALRYNDWMKKLNGGILTQKLHQDMNMKIKNNSTNKYKIYLYSGHEFNIVSMLQSLKVWNPHIPEYSSAIIIELYENKQGKYFVKILYYPGDAEKLMELPVENCDILCPFQKFVEATSDYLPSDNDIICDHKLIKVF